MPPTVKQFIPVPILDVASDVFHRCTKCTNVYLKEASLTRHTARAHPEERQPSDHETEAQESSFSCQKCDYR